MNAARHLRLVHDAEAAAERTARTMSGDAARAFILAGNATFTLQSRKTGAHYTFKVMAPGKGHDTDQPVRFVSLKAADGGAFFGTIRTDGGRLTYRTSPKAKAPTDHPGVVAFEWFAQHVLAGEGLWSAVQVMHVGKCGRCGRPLTEPESLARGLGPECAGKVGGA